MSFTSRRQAASLTGTDWVRYLDELAGEPIFSAPEGRVFVDAPYRANESADSPVDGEHLFELCERWLVAISAQTPAQTPKGSTA